MNRFFTAISLGALLLFPTGAAVAQDEVDPPAAQEPADPPAAQEPADPPAAQERPAPRPGLRLNERPVPAPTGGLQLQAPATIAEDEPAEEEQSFDDWLDEAEAEEGIVDQIDPDQAAEDEAWLRGDLGDAERGDAEHAEAADAEHGDAEAGDAEHGDAEHGDAEHGDAEHGDAEHGAGAAHEDHAAHGEPDMPAFFATVVNFLIWLGIVIFMARKPLSEFLKTRRHAIKDGIDEAARLTEAANAKYEDYSDRLERLDEELEKLRGEMIATGKAEADRIMVEAEEKAARIRRDAQFVIDQRVKQLRADLTREAVEAAIAAAEVALTEHVGASDQQRLADSYLEQIQQKINDEVQA